MYTNNPPYRSQIAGQQLGQNVPLSTSINLQDVSRQQYIQSPYQGQNLLQGANFSTNQPQYVSSQNRFTPQLSTPSPVKYDKFIILQQRIDLTTPQTVKEIHHVERPLEVITIEEIEGPWRQKCSTLERQILELQIQLRKGGLPQVETIEVIDDTKVKELEKRAQELRDQLRQCDAEVEELNEQIRQLQMQLEESGTSKITYLTTEVETWKKKFNQLNKDYAACQEELILVNAQLENLQKQQSGGGQNFTTTVKTTTKK